MIRVCSQFSLEKKKWNAKTDYESSVQNLSFVHLNWHSQRNSIDHITLSSYFSKKKIDLDLKHRYSAKDKRRFCNFLWMQQRFKLLFFFDSIPFHQKNRWVIVVFWIWWKMLYQTKAERSCSSFSFPSAVVWKESVRLQHTRSFMSDASKRMENERVSTKSALFDWTVVVIISWACTALAQACFRGGHTCQTPRLIIINRRCKHQKWV